MSRQRRDPSGELNPQGWMLTFSDLITLLLTFFVMIICITTQGSDSLLGMFDQKGQGLETGQGVMRFSNRAPLVPLIALVENLDRLPDDIMIDQDEIKTALFQLDPVSDQNYQRLDRAVHEAVDVFKDERGLVIRWDHDLLFPDGGLVLSREYDTLLNRLAAFLAAVSLPVSVEGHTNPFSELEGGRSLGAYKLSMRRAEVLMKYFVKLGLAEGRFRLGGHGGEAPLVTDDPSRFPENGRIEIIIYKPQQNSWRG